MSSRKVKRSSVINWIVDELSRHVNYRKHPYEMDSSLPIKDLKRAVEKFMEGRDIGDIRYDDSEDKVKVLTDKALEYCREEEGYDWLDDVPREFTYW